MTPARTLAVPAWLAESATQAVFAALAGSRTAADAAGLARAVGGCVRDHLLGQPVQDIDVATCLDPETVMARLQAAGIKTVPTGLQHGTVTAVAGERHVEITTLRVDVRTHGRRADVAFTDDWAADARRRDFTINALYLGPDGALYDPTGGLADLEDGIVRFIGDARARIREDYLRILRFFRFYGRFGRGAPEGDARAACADLADTLTQLSGERLRDETWKILALPAAPTVWAEMAETGVLEVYLAAWRDAATLGRLAALEAEFAWQGGPLRRLAAAYTGARTAAVSEAEATARRLRLSNAARHRLTTLTPGDRELAPERAAHDPQAFRRGLYRHRDGPAAELVLLEASRGNAGAALVRPALASIDTLTPPPFPLHGRDLLGLGYPTGPVIGETLQALERWWIERDFASDRAALLAEAERRRPGLES